MKMKRLLAAAMAATLLVSSSLMNTGMTSVYAQEESEIPEGRAYDADKKKIEEADQQEAEDWNGIVEVPEDKKYKEFDREADPKELKEVTEDMVNGEDAVPMENLEKTDAPKKEDKESDDKSDKKNDGTTIEEVDRSEVTADLTRDSEYKISEEQTIKDDEMVRVIILMEGNAVLEANPEAKWTFVNKLKASALEYHQNLVVSKIEKKVLDKKELDIRYNYTWLVNGVATEVPFGAIAEIEKISGVEKVILQQVYDTSKEQIAPYTISDGPMIGREETWVSGYTGKGIKVAIVDTGLDSDHPSFGALPEEALTEESATKDTISKVLEGTNAAEKYNGLNTDQVYYSTKVAYGFNYVDRNLDITHDNDTEGDHGTHVAGIAAANAIDKENASIGVAPDAQLYVMKVFGKHGGAYTDDIVAALEDSLILGADVVNMSLGSPAGFSADEGWINEVYDRVATTNTILAVAAGNASTSGMGNLWGTNTNLAENPDNSTVSSPATYANVTSVASVNNIGIMSHYVAVGDKKFGYSEGSKGQNEPISTIAGKEFDFVVVPNFGQSLEDFTGAKGKVALVQRGVTAFTEKIAFAEEAGAVACLVYNNAVGDFGMDLTGGTSTIPNASISMIAGEYIVSAKAANPELKLQFSEKAEQIPTLDGYTMSDFSSWGISPDLSLEPDVTAPGGNIYSTLDNGQYGMMSGTSMASPNIAGISALVMQYAKKAHPEMSASELHTYVNAVILSTAEPLMYAEGLTYSPRNQGAGLANAYSAINTKAYLSVDSNDMPKVELGDDPAKSGNYSYTFHVNNIGDKTLYYDADTSVETEDVMEVEEYKFMATTPIALDAAAEESGSAFVLTYDYNENEKVNTSDARYLYMKVLNEEADDADEFFRYNLKNDEAVDYADVQAYLDELVDKDAGVDLQDKVLQVKAGKTADIDVNIAVSQAGKDYMDTNFANGIYVEGYTVLTAKNAGGVDLSIPYMGFYGDWTKAPLLDCGYYWEDEAEMTASQYPHILFTQFGEQDWVPGMNPYIAEPFDINNISLSPNGDGYADYIMEIYVSLMRNAATLSFTYEDAESGEVYSSQEVEHVTKSYFSPSYGQIIPYVASWDLAKLYDLTTEEGKPLANDTKLKLKIAGTIDYNKHESDNLFDTWEVPITVDTEAPVVNAEKSKVVVEGGEQYLQLTYKDNVGVAAVNILNKSGTSLLAQYPSSGEMDEATGEYTERYKITGYGNQFMVVLGDYALNEAEYKFKTDNNVPIPNASKLYGYRVFDENYKDDSLFGWVGMDKKDASLEVQSSEYYMDYALTAAEYVGGYIIAVDANNELLAIRPGEWDERTKIASLGKKVTELAFDPADQVLYGFNKSDWSIVTIDVVTGEMEKVSKGYITSFTAMTCGDDGTLYVLDGAGKLKVFDKETGTVGAEVLDTSAVTKSKPASYSQSMTFDAEEGCIYWAGYFGTQASGLKAVLYKIDVKDGCQITEVAKVPGNAELVGLLKLDARGYQLPEATLEEIAVEETGAVLLVGSQEALTPVIKPWYAPVEGLTWTSKDPAVVTVDEDGVLTGVGEGTTKVTLATTDGEFQAECPVSVVSPKAELNGFVVSSNHLDSQWVKADVEDLKNFEALTEADYVTYTAGEYVDGTIYAYNETTEFYKIDAETKKATRIADANKEYQVVDMSYDYTNGYMYGIAQSLLDGMTYLVHVDMNTGALEVVGAAMDAYGAPVCAMAVATDGTIYMISYTGLLNQYDLEAEELVKIGLTGYTGSQMLQSMAYDHNTDSLYWAMLSGSNEVAVAYVDVTSGKALPLGNIDGGAQITAMYIVPEKVPERAEVPVTEVKMLQESILVLKDSTKTLPVEVQPFNATDRNVTWTVADPEIAEVKNGAAIGKKVGTTTATGTLGSFTVEVTINVAASAGEIRGYVLTDLATGAGQFWGAFDDRDLSSGEGIANGSEYLLSAGEYYNGKVYGYGLDMETYDTQYMIFDGETLELEEKVAGEYPDMRDMAFDYSTGCMYAIGGVRNVEDMCALYAVDTVSGKTYKIADLDVMLFGLACSTDGTLYGISQEGVLYIVDKTTAELTAIGETGYYANQYQAMAFDHNTGNLYWAQVFNDSWTWQTSANLLLVDPKDASAEELGQIGIAGCQVTAMHIVPKKEIPTGTPEVSKVVLSSAAEVMKPGDTLTLSAQAFPVSVNLKDVKVTYRSSDAAVATVDADGKVTAVKEGSVKIIAESGAHQAECSIAVVGDSTKLQVVNKNGWESSPLLSPDKIDSKVSFPEGMSVIAAAKNNDGFCYAVGEDGYLWKYTEDLETAEKVGETPIAEQFDNRDGFNLDMEEPQVIDIAAVDGKVYALGYGVVGNDAWDMMWEYFVYELNLETGAATSAAEVPVDIARPVAMTFTDKETIVMFDGFLSYMYSMKLGSSKDDHAKSLVWAQNVVTAGETMGMVYSPKLDRIFLATADDYNNNAKMALYVMSPSAGSIAKVGDAAYNPGMVDLILP